MMHLTLTIGDKNLSSWSLRPWLLMKQAGIEFTEENIKLDRFETRIILKEHSPSGLVPFLSVREEGRQFKVWDSLAIMDYVADTFPEKNLWPSETEPRAIARAVATEMHSGFSALRSYWPMMFTREGIAHLTTGGVGRDIDRVNDLWTMCRERYGADGEFLFGGFSIADAMFAPVASRFRTYGPVELSPAATQYMETILTLPAMKEWGDGAREEIIG